MKEIVGNLVVTDLQKYLQKPVLPLTPNNESIADQVNEFSKSIPYDFNRVRRSVIDAYEGIFSFCEVSISIIYFILAAITAKNKDIGKQRLVQFESEAGHESQIAIINADSLAKHNEVIRENYF
jgi:hypothetical protein